MTVRQDLLRRGGRRSAFTLMEVLVVVAILVVLAGVGVPLYLRYLEDSKKDIAKTTASQLGQACVTFHVKYQRLPESLQELVQPPDGGKPYVEPKMLQDPWGKPFQYQPEGPNNGALGKPDVFTVAPDGTQIGNW
jgi:general secretion pathway protein G